MIYLSGLYNFLISVVGVVAMGAIVIGGARYLTSAGNPSAIDDAKHTINSAIYGLLLAITSWVIVSTINPDILVLKNPGMPFAGIGYDPSSNTTPDCAFPLGEGTIDKPCTCADEAIITSKNATKTPTVLTLTVVPDALDFASLSVATNVILSGKLTDDKGVPLNAMTIKINRIAPLLPAANTYTVTTNASGDYTYTMSFPPAGRGTGVGGDQIQAVFAGTVAPAPGYASVGSNVVTFTRDASNGTYMATDYSYYTNPLGGLTPVPTIFINGNDCNTICSNKTLASDSIFHCVIPRLGIGKIPEQAKEGIRTLEGIKKNVDSVFFDTVTNTKSGFKIARVEVHYLDTGWDWLLGATPDYKYYYTADCGGTAGTVTFTNSDKNWHGTNTTETPGQFSHIFDASDSFKPKLFVFIKENGCVAEFLDQGTLIKVVD